MFGLEEILLIPLVFGAFSLGAGWGQRARGGVIIGVLMTGFALKTMMPGLDVRWLGLWPWLSLAEIAAIWGTVCWIGFLGGSGGWFTRRARARRGAMPEPESPWAYVPLVIVVAGILWLGREPLMELIRNGGRVPGGVPMAAPPTMIHRMPSAPVPNRASWGLVLMLFPFVVPGIGIAAAGLANRNLAFIFMGGVFGFLPLLLCMTDPSTRLAGDMLATLGALCVASAAAGYRWGLTRHRLLAVHGRPTTWRWDHSRDDFLLAMERINREEEKDRRERP